MGAALWRSAARSGADLLWRAKCNTVLPVRRALADGSFLSEFAGAPARVVEYTLAESDEERYRLLSTLLDPLQAPAAELAALYHERWEIETAFDEIKTPDLVRQEIEGHMLAYYAVRHLLHAAAREAAEDPDRLSFVHAVRVVRRRIQNPAVPPLRHRKRALERAVRDEILEERVVSSRGQSKPRGVKRKMSKFKVGHRGPISREVHDWEPAIVIPAP
ncbi:MAG: transposase [Bryobacterales bacterium]|nr:transposase [Bryobacterales bacterium]